MGITRPGTVSATIGTSGVVFAATDRPALDPKGRLHTFCHAIPGRWHVMGVTQAAGLSLRWLRDLFTAEGKTEPLSYERMTDEAALAPPGADGVLWGPYLMGERAPHLDPDVRAGLVGLAANHTRAHVIRAVMEGVAFSLRDSLTIFSELGVPVEKIRVGRWRSTISRSGARFRRMSTTTLLKSSKSRRVRRSVQRFWPESAQGFGQAVDDACDKTIHALREHPVPAACC